MSIKNANNNSIGGKFLCSGNLRDVRATGELGQSVYQIANALRETIRRHSKTDTALEKFFAIPFENHGSNTVDWYADSSIAYEHGTQTTTIINWNQADAAEQAAAKEKILHFKKEVEALSHKLAQNQDSSNKDLYTFSQLLPKMLFIPSRFLEIKDNKSIIDPSYIFLVGNDQQPVIAFWGFTHLNALENEEPFHFLKAAALTPPQANNTEVKATAAAMPNINNTPPPSVSEPIRTGVWSWLRWLLLALLLIALLLFGLRTCSKPTLPSVSGIANPTAQSVTDQSPGRLWGMDLPKVPFINNWPQLNLPSWMPRFGLGSTGIGSHTNTGTGTGTGTETITEQARKNINPPTLDPTAIHPTAIDPATITSTPTIDTTTPNLAPPAPNAVDPSVLGKELQIPPQLINNAIPNYIDGDWKVYGIQDQKTGRPVRLEYDIKDGAGNVHIQKSDGVSCDGSIQAAGMSSGLQINSTSQASCADGSVYDMPKIECRLNAKQATECFGVYGNQQFPISMRHATD